MLINLAYGQRADPQVLARAAAVGMAVPPGYTFVDTYFWPRATDPRSAATALRVTVAVSSLWALLQTATASRRGWWPRRRPEPTDRRTCPRGRTARLIGAGVKIIGDSHGPVRIGSRVQILENAVLHLLPDNELIVEDDVVIGPGGMIHGCHIGAGSIIEPAAIVCDWAVVGRNCLVRAGSIVVQRSHVEDNVEIAGCLGEVVG